MRKSYLFFIIAVIFLISSVLVFLETRAETTTDCWNIECGNYIQYTDAFTKNPLKSCPEYCRLGYDEFGNPASISYESSSSITVIFIYLYVFFFILSLIFYLIESFTNKQKPELMGQDY